MHSGFKRGTRYEVSTAGRDPALALVRGNPYGTATGPGLIIPTVATAPNFRYLFMLAAAQFDAGEIARLVGMRQYATLGVNVDAGVDNPADDFSYPVELPITTPTWHPSDATISWHLRRMDTTPNANMSEFNRPGLRFRLTESPALLFENAPDQVGGYKPPYGGRPPGNIFVPDLGSFQDIRFRWDSDRAWDSLDVEIKGPCMIALFASVQQTNPSTRPTLALPDPFIGGGLPPEEIFLQNFTGARYHRIAGSLIFEQPALLEEDGNEQPWCPPGNRPALPVSTGRGGDYNPPGAGNTRNRRLDT